MNETYTQKDNQHFHACSVLGCDYTDTPVNCSGGTKTCQAKAVCDTCGNAYGDFATHSYTTVNGYKESDGHANTCSCGAHDTVVPHTPNADDGDCTTEITCSVCSETTIAASTHTDTNTDGKCDACGKDMPTTPGGDEPGNGDTNEPGNGGTNEPTDDNSGLGTGAIIGIIFGIVAVLGIGGFAIYWFVIKKKKK